MTDSDNFHVIAQMNDGKWINKHGGNAIETLGYINPDVTKQPCWYDKDSGKYYDSPTYYIKCTLKSAGS